MERANIQLSVRETLDKISASTPKYKSAFFGGHEVNLGILNLKVFKLKGIVCKCGLVGSVFYVEKTGGPGRTVYNDWHLNLYAVNDQGQEVMMTKDHIIPKSKGGTDDISNLEPMCKPCNGKKGDKL